MSSFLLSYIYVYLRMVYVLLCIMYVNRRKKWFFFCFLLRLVIPVLSPYTRPSSCTTSSLNTIADGHRFWKWTVLSFFVPVSPPIYHTDSLTLPIVHADGVNAMLFSSPGAHLGEVVWELNLPKHTPTRVSYN